MFENKTDKLTPLSVNNDLQYTRRFCSTDIHFLTYNLLKIEKDLGTWEIYGYIFTFHLEKLTIQETSGLFCIINDI